MHKSKLPVYAISMDNDTEVAVTTHNELAAFILNATPSAKLFKHPACKTSEESMEARYKASGERVVGAKALLVKLDLRDQPDTFAVIVLPGFSRLDSKLAKKEFKERIPGSRGFRFATADEMEHAARGMQPGKMPPFGRPIFPDVVYTFIDQALLKQERIGFNAADFEKSIIMNTDEYLDIVTHDGVFACSRETGH